MTNEKSRWFLTISDKKGNAILENQFVRIDSRPTVNFYGNSIVNSDYWIAGKQVWNDITVTFDTQTNLFTGSVQANLIGLLVCINETDTILETWTLNNLFPISAVYGTCYGHFSQIKFRYSFATLDCEPVIPKEEEKHTVNIGELVKVLSKID